MVTQPEPVAWPRLVLQQPVRALARAQLLQQWKLESSPTAARAPAAPPWPSDAACHAPPAPLQCVRIDATKMEEIVGNLYRKADPDRDGYIPGPQVRLGCRSTGWRVAATA